MKKPSSKFSTLVAVSGGLAAMPVAAIELGEAQVNSSLGQPLRASIAYALGPNEAIADTCVSLQGGMNQGGGLPGTGPASISVADGIISITGQAAVREPLLSMRLNVRCPYTAQISRDYMLFIDPAVPPQQITASQPATTPAPAPVAVADRPRTSTPRATTRPAPNRAPIANGTRIRVQPRDTLSEIAQRIENRPIGLWAAVGAIFDANPEAFIDNDPNKLKAGSWLTIPDFGTGVAPVLAQQPVFPDATAASDTAASGTSYPGLSADTDAVSATAVPEPVEAPVSAPVAEPGSADISDNPFVTPASEPVVDIADTEVEPPVATSSSPNVPVATIQPTPAPAEPAATNWLFWLAGTGLALIAAMLFFGRLVRQRFGSSPIAAVAPPQQRRRTDGNTRRMETVSEIEVVEIDQPPSPEKLALDADLIVGTGLQESSDIDVAQDFGFAATSELDLELPEEMSSGGEETPQTDIIPPLNVEMNSILESEVLPDDEADEDDYDMSVIVDATKMPTAEDVTERDLAAVPVDTSDDTLITGDYTVSHEVDYKVLEQDYEDEFTATQALNNEISRAAAELAERMDEQFGEEDTRDMSMASVTALDMTAQLPADNDDTVISDLDDTGINEAVTVNMRDADQTVEMEGDDHTIEMPAKKGRSA